MSAALELGNMKDSYLQYSQRLSNKRLATEEDLVQYRKLNDGRFAIFVNDYLVPLLREDDDDHLDDEEKLTAIQGTAAFRSALSAMSGTAAPSPPLPTSVDHRPSQTPIRFQDGRGTCVSFASLAAMEAILKVQGQQLDLSEQYAHWMFMRLKNRNHCQDNLKTVLSAKFLSQFGVCEESDSAYEDLATVQQHCSDSPSASAKGRAKFGIGSFTLIDGPSIGSLGVSDTTYLETLLAAGHDIVMGVHVAWGQPDANGVLDLLLDSDHAPVKSRGGHAILLVGYEQNAPIPYFMAKNSHGPLTATQPFWFFSYDYIRTYAKYGYVITNMRSDMSGSPP